MIEIRVRINDLKTLEQYLDIADETIIKDFLGNPLLWLKHPETEIEVMNCSWEEVKHESRTRI